MKKMLVTMVLIVGIVASLPTVEAATNETDKIVKPVEMPETRGFIEDILCSGLGFCPIHKRI